MWKYVTITFQNTNDQKAIQKASRKINQANYKDKEWKALNFSKWGLEVNNQWSNYFKILGENLQA
jgi:hypothetical protein